MKKLVNIKILLLFLVLVFSQAGWQIMMAQVDNTQYVLPELDISNGSITIEGNDTKNYIIIGETTNNDNYVTIKSGYKGTIKFRDLKITHTYSSLGDPTHSIVIIEGERDRSNREPKTIVNIVLEGNNELYYRRPNTSSHSYGGGCCIEVMQGAQINIRSIDENDNSKGKLTAHIQSNTNITRGSGGGGAAIGARIYNIYSHETGKDHVGQAEGVAQINAMDRNNNGHLYRNTAGGNIIISSGTVDALGGHGAGIGGGFRTYYNGMIVIYGGDVYSRAWRHAAGIGSGCPNGNGVEKQYTPESATIALPPAKTEGYGADEDGTMLPDYTLAGAKSVVYVNDPRKPELLIFTEDSLHDANIYADLTRSVEIKNIFNILELNSKYDLTKAKFGKTSAVNGVFSIHAFLQDSVTFFTDASSDGVKYPDKEGRPYLPVDTVTPDGTATQKHKIKLPFLPVDIFMQIFEATSKPLVQGYSVAEAKEKAYHLKIMYKDINPMTKVKYELEDGTAFDDLIFLDADSVKTISAPTTLTEGMIFYIIVPLKHNMAVNNYRDVLAISGEWKGINTGKIRKVPEQRVVLDDTNENKHIKVTAKNRYGAITNPASYTETLTLNINHTGLPGNSSFNKDDIQARYLITTEPDYDAAVALTPVNKWPYLNAPTQNNQDITTTVSFTDKTSGTYYIHWFVISGPVYAHSKTVIGPPPATHGGFGPYSFVGLNNDLATTFEYGSLGINILDNDVLLPITLNGITSALDLVTEQPKAGVLSANGHQIVYKHTNAVQLTHHIDSFAYQVDVGGGEKLDAKVYIYVIKSNNGSFTACKNEDYIISLQGTDVTYTWYDINGDPLGTGSTRTINTIQNDTQFWVAPMRTANPYRDLSFPSASLIVKVADNNGTATMRWTGAIDTCWHNPGNWVDITGGVETPASWLPNKCINVIIPSGAPNYPVMTEAGECQNIQMLDRAMLAGIHHLTYAEASVELKLKNMERNRFVMWSPPLDITYTGDYHFTNSGLNDPADYYWGDVYMSFFQAKNPDNAGSIAAANHFTATFGNVWERLQPGQAFILKVANTTGNQSKSFMFPKTAEKYKDATGKEGPNGWVQNLTRISNTNYAKFMSDVVINNSNKLPVVGDMTGANFVQVVNPFMAYLKVEEFLNANSSVISKEYKIWNGRVNEDTQIPAGDVVTIKPALTDGQRYVIDNLDMISNATEISAGLIPPLQSFFVKKRNANSVISTLNLNPAWTTTVNRAITGDYQLRAETKETHTLRIKASQQNMSNTTVLFNQPGAIAAYSDEEDGYKLFYSDAAIAVYSLTPAKDPLAINTTGNFDQNINLGLRMQNEGQVTFTFTGMETFGQKVYLIDNELKGKDKEIDIQKNPSYTFTVNKSSTNGGFVEINDRFSLRFEYDPFGIENITDHRLQVSAKDGYIDIQSKDKEISKVYIYDMKGVFVSGNTTSSSRYHIPVARQHTYLVKGIVDGKEYVQKVFVD